MGINCWNCPCHGSRFDYNFNFTEQTNSDDRVLAAYLKGSRTNPNVPKDIYQDYDIMYVVKETESFRKDLSWLDIFGRVILKQEQDDDFGYGDRFGLRSHYEETYSWLLLFEDGNRLDIGVETVEAMRKGNMTDYSVSCGKLNKYFKRYLPEDYEHGFLKYMEIVGAGEYFH